jgi:hypothetical protein
MSYGSMRDATLSGLRERRKKMMLAQKAEALAA